MAGTPTSADQTTLLDEVHLVPLSFTALLGCAPACVSSAVRREDYLAHLAQGVHAP